MTKIRVYGASKLDKRDMWINLREEWSEIEWTARWPSLVGIVPDEPCFARIFWERDLEDIHNSDVVLVYAEDGGKLRGALVEAGMAIAIGKYVIVVGDHIDYGTWQYHPLVLRVPDLDNARLLLKTMTL